VKLGRHEIDRIACLVVSGERGHGRVIDGLADVVASLMRNRLEAAGVPGARRVVRAEARSRRPDPDTLRPLIERAGKLLASALVTDARAPARPR